MTRLLSFRFVEQNSNMGITGITLSLWLQSFLEFLVDHLFSSQLLEATCISWFTASLLHYQVRNIASLLCCFYSSHLLLPLPLLRTLVITLGPLDNPATWIHLCQVSKYNPFPDIRPWAFFFFFISSTGTVYSAYNKGKISGLNMPKTIALSFCAAFTKCHCLGSL